MCVKCSTCDVLVEMNCQRVIATSHLDLASFRESVFNHLTIRSFSIQYGDLHLVSLTYRAYYLFSLVVYYVHLCFFLVHLYKVEIHSRLPLSANNLNVAFQTDFELVSSKMHMLANLLVG